MRDPSSYNPWVLLSFLCAAVGVPMLSMDPGLSLLCLCCGALFLAARRRSLRGLGGLCALTLLPALVSPLFNHRGETALLVLNHNPITLEALLWGLSMGVTVLAVLVWFMAFSDLLTTDKVLYLLSPLSPKIALVLSMALRFVPLFVRRAKQVQEAQQASGLYGADDPVGNVRGGARVFSVLASWGLEQGIVTADSMEARGWGSGRRTAFSVFRFRRTDGAALVCILLLLSGTVWGIAAGAVRCSFEPRLTLGPVTRWGVVTHCCYGLLLLLPTACEVGEEIRWNFLLSKN